MEQMPDEVLIMIFKKLPSFFLTATVARVCQRWQRLIDYRHLWMQNIRQLHDIHSGLVAVFVLRNIPTLSSTTLISNLSLKTHCLRELIINAEMPLGRLELMILESLQHLQHLDIFLNSVLSNSTPLPPNLSSLVANNTMNKDFLHELERRKKITCFHMYGMSLYYNNRAMRKFLVAHRMHLTDLTLRCNEFLDIGFAAVARCGALRRLRLFACWLLTAGAAPPLARLPRLRRLHLTGARMVRRRAMHDFIANLSPSIEELNLSSSSFIDEHCSALVNRLPHLKSLELWRCKVSSDAILNLAKELKSLEKLDTDVRLEGEQLEQLGGRELTLRQRWKCESGGRVGATLIRGGGEGPSAERFYSWADELEAAGLQPGAG